MGRGGKNNQHSGNEKLRIMARKVCDDYKISTKKGKSIISRHLVSQVRAMTPPGRYVLIFFINNALSCCIVRVYKFILVCKRFNIFVVSSFSFLEPFFRFLKRDQDSGKWEDVGDDVGTF